MPRTRPTPPDRTKKPETRGRKTIPPSEWDRLLDALKLGHLDKDACILAGVSRETFYKKIKEDSDFSDKVNKARLHAKDMCVKMIRKTALTRWTAAAWWLERKYRDEFAVKYIQDGEQKHVHDFSPKAKELLKGLSDEEASNV